MPESKTAHRSPLPEETATVAVQNEGRSSTKEADKVKAQDTDKKTPHRTGCFFTEKQTWLTSTVYSLSVLLLSRLCGESSP